MSDELYDGRQTLLLTLVDNRTPESLAVASLNEVLLESNLSSSKGLT